jgi:hypothetical protein
MASIAGRCVSEHQLYDRYDDAGDAGEHRQHADDPAADARQNEL